MTPPFDLPTVWDEAGETRKANVRSAQEGLDLFDRLHRATAGSPTMIHFGPNGSHGILSVGVGRPQAVLAFQATLDPPYYVSRGRAERDDDTWFLSGGENTQFPTSRSVPI